LEDFEGKNQQWKLLVVKKKQSDKSLINLKEKEE